MAPSPQEIRMPFRRSHLVLTGLATLSLVLATAGCSAGSGASATTAVAGNTASASPAGATVSQSAAAGATSAAGDACSILPAQDVQAALGVSGVTATPLGSGAGASACTYQSADGTPLAATVYTASGGAQFDSFKAAPGAVQIPGIADGAVFINPTLYVRKGDALFAVQLIATANLTPDKLQLIASRLGAAVAGHM
jgi:hypothetical protein